MNTMGPAEPLVSAVIPCFNAAATLGRAIASVRSQAYRNIEIITIDDGSRDETPTLLRAEAERGVVVITQPNGGVPVARNSGIAVARGEFIAFLDSDGRMAPGQNRAAYANACQQSRYAHGRLLGRGRHGGWQPPQSECGS